MHEMSLCESMLQIIEEQARTRGYSKVLRVRLEIGALAGVEPGALRFGFEVVRRGTLADEAELEIIELPGKAWCLSCCDTVDIRQRFDACPQCGGVQLQTTGGHEIRIKDLEVE
jgi:hydrogenase nickel incorporation protein HypA/HybF